MFEGYKLIYDESNYDIKEFRKQSKEDKEKLGEEEEMTIEIELSHTKYVILLYKTKARCLSKYKDNLSEGIQKCYQKIDYPRLF